MVGLEYLTELKEFLQQATELIPYLREFLQEFKLLVVDLVALIALIISAWWLVFGKLSPRSLEANGTARDDQVEKKR